MLNIYQIYDKLLTLFKKNNPKQKNKESYLASLFFGIRNTDKDSVDIECLLPDVSKKDIEEIMNISERYAELLTYINSDKFNKHIYEILQNNKSKNKYDYKYIMLIDNIIHFWDVFYQLENKKQYLNYKKDQPLIKPSQAFVIKQ